MNDASERRRALPNHENTSCPLEPWSRKNSNSLLLVTVSTGTRPLISRVPRSMLCALISGCSPLNANRLCYSHSTPPPKHPANWASADAEIKGTSVENPECKDSPFKAWRRSVYSHACSLPARDFFPANVHPSGPLTCIFPKPLPSLSCVGFG